MAGYDDLPLELKWHIFDSIDEEYRLRTIKAARLANKQCAAELVHPLARHGVFTIMCNDFGIRRLEFVAASQFAPYIREIRFADVYTYHHFIEVVNEESSRIKRSNMNLAEASSGRPWPSSMDMHTLVTKQYIDLGPHSRKSRSDLDDELAAGFYISRRSDLTGENSILFWGEIPEDEAIGRIATLLQSFKSVRTIGTTVVIKWILQENEIVDDIGVTEVTTRQFYTPATPHWLSDYLGSFELSQNHAVKVFSKVIPQSVPGFGDSVVSLKLISGRSGDFSVADLHATLKMLPSLETLVLDERPPAYGERSILEHPTNITERLVGGISSFISATPFRSLRHLEIKYSCRAADLATVFEKQVKTLRTIVVPGHRTALALPGQPISDNDAQAMITQLESLKSMPHLKHLLLLVPVFEPTNPADYTHVDIMHPITVGEVPENVIPRTELLDFALAYYRAVLDGDTQHALECRKKCREAKERGFAGDEVARAAAELNRLRHELEDSDSDPFGQDDDSDDSDYADDGEDEDEDDHYL